MVTGIDNTNMSNIMYYTVFYINVSLILTTYQYFTYLTRKIKLSEMSKKMDSLSDNHNPETDQLPG